jgi:putative acetyltransferase
VILREETTRLEAAIRVMHRSVFERDDESKLIDRLRADGLIVASVIAEEEGLIVGHVLFSNLRVETQHGNLPAAALAPIGVLAEWRGCGIGSALIHEGMDLCRQRGKSAAIVLGEPRYYSRFGFSSDLVKNLRSPYASAGDAWMAAELKPDSLHNVYGFVEYPPPFSLLPADKR